MLSRLFKSLLPEIKKIYRINVYHGPDQKEKVQNIKNQIRKRYPELRLSRTSNNAHGYHPAGGFRFSISEERLAELKSFLEKIHDGVSILIHPDNGFLPLKPADLEGEKALWLGPKLKIDKDYFSIASMLARHGPLP